MATIGIKDLKTHLSEYVSRAAAGESVVVTDRGSPVAMIGPLPVEIQVLEAMRREGRIQWAGGKPKGIARPKAKQQRRFGPNVSGAVIEGRER
jgi:prevent-host-death family protein